VIYHQLKTPIPPMPMMLPHGVEAVIRRALSKKRDERYGSAREFATAVRGVMDGDPSTTLPWLASLLE
jgi:hypothetical protein